MAVSTLSAQIEDFCLLCLFPVLYQPLFVSVDQICDHGAVLVSESTLCRRGKVASWYVHNL